MKCMYCNRNAEWIYPSSEENKFLCEIHAAVEFDELKKLPGYEMCDTIKDVFLKFIETDKDLINLTLNTKTGVVNNANYNWK